MRIPNLAVDFLRTHHGASLRITIVLVTIDSVQALVEMLPLLVEVLEVGGTDDADEKSVVTFCLYGDVLLQLGIGAGADMRFHAEQLDAYERYFAQRFKEGYHQGM